MPIPFKCPHCHHETLVEDKYAGESGACVECGKSITVPLAITQGAVVPDEKPTVPGAAAVSISVGCILIVLLLFFFVVSGFGLWWLW